MGSATSELPSQRTPLTAAAETGLKIVVVGGFGVGKTTLVRSVSEIRPLNTEELMTQAGQGIDETAGVERKTTTTVAFDFGRISLNDRMVLYLFGAPGQERFWFLWDRLFAGTLGAVVLVDTRRMEDCWYAIDRLEHHGTPFVVAVNRFDGDEKRFSLDEVRQALALGEHVPMIECDARVRASGKEVLIALVDHLYTRALAKESTA
ncbi:MULTISPECIES: GTP-binding protein [Streptomyces]|uniref:ATP-binding protein n=3 Tax=Streptomyces TaxID=1883 RepID=A0A117QB64_STRCK|nr:ATP/GTP-binding protein [Streptomyces corchorusii]AAU11084.2 CvhD [Streptomyces hygroscopicus subsp. yingchengensis]AEY86604.1 CvhD-ATP/GTP binding protein [Streptomyces hygroscopicus subsp. jinggangensis 5008]AGF60828.1 CvhD-ATP/GTP binding protein [Streptomyces hygroscopicus subsp. jinggangensis TL01]ALP00071.1 CvhD-ATP/GTP binding protein [Streptomyces hygroscopicus subsp. limoneus]KUN18719.1 ATP-binding protein [Streptomyces corchorusii]